MRNTYQALMLAVAIFGLAIGLSFAGGAFYGRKTAKAVAAPVATQAAGAGALGGGGAIFGGGAGGAGGAGGSGGAGGQAAAGSATPSAGGSAAAGQGGQGRGAGGGGGGAQGVIESVNGNTVTLRTQSGTTTVTLGQDTEIRQTVPAQASDLKAGQTVLVVGTPDADGKIQARNVTISASR